MASTRGCIIALHDSHERSTLTPEELTERSAREADARAHEQQVDVAAYDQETAPPPEPSLHTIRVFIHVLARAGCADEEVTDDRIRSQIDVLNQDYRCLNDLSPVPDVWKTKAASPGVAFDWASQDVARFFDIHHDDPFQPWECATYSAARANYLNIWVCALAGDRGCASYPWWYRGSLNGVVISHRSFGVGDGLDANFDRGRTATHEVGHWLGLHHIESDWLRDTPATMPFNFMEAGSSDNQMAMFTKSQVAVMRHHLTHRRKNALLP